MTALGIFRPEFEEPGVDEPTSAEELATFEDRPGIAPLRVEDLLIPAGVYYLQVAGSGEEQYQLRITPGQQLPALGDQEPNEDEDTATPVSGAFAVSGDLAGSEDWFAWTLTEADAGQRWQLTAQGVIAEGVHIYVYPAEGGEALTRTVAGQTGRAALYDLGLDAGTYLIRVQPDAAGETDYALEAVSLGERALDLEEEPNQDRSTAYRIAPGQSLTGRLAGPEDVDVYRMTIDTELAARRLDVTLSTASGATRRLCLIDPADEELQCRETEGSPALLDLTLAPGDYGLSVGGSPDLNSDYALRFVVGDDAALGHEAEPNDNPASASLMGEQLAVLGRTAGSETDVFRFTVEGAPQLWRVQALGTGLSSLSYLNAAGDEEQERSAEDGARLVRMSNLFLLPGEHWIAVRGTDASYTLRAIPIGPPDPGAEQEPNDDPSRAHVLRVGEPRNGLLTEAGDRDAYRFFLAAEEHIVLRVEPPPDGSLSFALDWGG
jgi:hypothetical protein